MHIARITSIAVVVLGAAMLPLGAQQNPAAVDSAYHNLGVTVYPTRGQTAAQQQTDQRTCWTAATGQTGFDPLHLAKTEADSITKAAESAAVQSLLSGAFKHAPKNAAHAATSTAHLQVDTFRHALGACLQGLGYASTNTR